MEKLLNTYSVDSIYNSLSKIFKIQLGEIKNYILMNKFKIINQYEKNEWIDAINIDRLITPGSNNVNQLFDSITISHLTSRLNKPSIKDPLYNTFNSLILDTDLSNFLKINGITFKLINGKIKVIHDGTTINWKTDVKEEFSSFASMLQFRLEGNSNDTDKCINGFLFNGRIYENTHVSHLFGCQEIVQHILTALDNINCAYEWSRRAKPYIITFKSNLEDIIFDGYSLNYDQKVVRIIRYCLYFLSKKFLCEWNENENLMIRLRDNLNVNHEDILYVSNIE